MGLDWLLWSGREESGRHYTSEGARRVPEGRCENSLRLTLLHFVPVFGYSCGFNRRRAASVLGRDHARIRSGEVRPGDAGIILPAPEPEAPACEPFPMSASSSRTVMPRVSLPNHAYLPRTTIPGTARSEVALEWNLYFPTRSTRSHPLPGCWWGWRSRRAERAVSTSEPHALSRS